MFLPALLIWWYFWPRHIEADQWQIEIKENLLRSQKVQARQVNSILFWPCPCRQTIRNNIVHREASQREWNHSYSVFCACLFVWWWNSDTANGSKMLLFTWNICHFWGFLFFYNITITCCVLYRLGFCGQLHIKSMMR